MSLLLTSVKSTFNESVAISWTIYNSICALAIGIGIVVFVGAVEDTLFLLVLLLLAWICFSAWGLILLPKFHALFQTEEEQLEASRSELAQEKSNGLSTNSADRRS